MRTQIIHIDHYDDLVSVRKKLFRVKSPQVFLIFPNHSSILDSPHALLLLNRLARRLSINLAIISIHKEIASQCADLQISHFSSIEEAKSSTWSHPDRFEKAYLKSRRVFSEQELLYRKRIPPQKTSIFLRVGLIFGVIISFSIVVLVISPSATIFIHPKNIVQTSSIKFTSSSGVDGSARREFVRALPFTRGISETIIINTSGSTIIKNEYAMGSVRFENLTDEVVSVPSGTVVMTTGEHPIRYLTIEDGIIPAGVGEYALVGVQATRAGPEGNIGSNEVKIVEGFLGSMIQVTNPGLLKGGTEKRVAAASDEDRLSAENDLSNKIQEKCSVELSNDVPAGDLFLGVSSSFDVIAIEEFPDETQPSDYFSLGMDASCLGWYARMEDILTLSTQVLDEEMPGGFQAANDVIFDKISSITHSEENYSWEVSLERSITTAIDLENLVLQILGKNQSTVIKMIEEQYFLEEKPRIVMLPNWWPLMPIIASQITVEIIE